MCIRDRLKNQEITNEMEQALEDGQFHVFLQPQFNLVNNRLVGAEALVRWIHPTEGVIRPDVFIPVFESNGFIYKLDAFVCESVCKLLAKWKSEGKMCIRDRSKIFWQFVREFFIIEYSRMQKK